MGTKRKTVKELAQEASLDLDEALVALWDAGFGKLMGPQDQIVSGDLNRARRALGLATRRELKTPGYWSSIFTLDPAGFSALLLELGIKLSPNAKTLPPKSVVRLRREARRRGIDPVTGGDAAQGKPVTKLPVTDFEWKPIGHERELRWLSDREVLAIHYALVDDFAGTSDPLDPPGVRSENLMSSAVFRPQTSIGETFKYPTIETSAAALLHSLIQNHPFHNGNKRSAMVAMLVFLDENGFMLTCNEDELFRLVLLVAQHRMVDSRLGDRADREVLAIAEWLWERVRAVEVGDRPTTWRKLRRILTSYGCELTFPAGVGNRINITRRVTTRGMFGIRSSQVLKTQVFYGDEGREAEKNTVKKIREDLQLDDLNGVDSYAFYGQAPNSPSDFISKYRKTLRRLAKL